MKKYNGRDVKPSRERMYELVRGPVVTEKATLISEHNQVTFWVPLDANKFEPREGRMLMFPSFEFHRTIPFESSEQRISIAFDLLA